MAEKVVINDVGPRDGLQNQSKILLPAQRLQLINKLLAAGLRHIEVGAFVSPKAVPAMAGTDEVAAGLPQGDYAFSALIPNRKGYELAIAAGIKNVGLVIAASNTMNERNINMGTERALAVCEEVLAQAKRDGVNAQVYVATAWECPFEGQIDAAVVADLSEKLLAAGATGNVATEDVVLMLNQTGFDTGINLAALIAAADLAAALTDNCDGGHSSRWIPKQIEKGALAA